MSVKTLSFLARFDLAPEALWRVVTDHEGMGDWLDARVSVIAGPGDGGVGTVRRIAAGPLAIDEEVTLFNPPRRLVYRIIRGLPLAHHQGQMRVEPWGAGGSELHWDVTIGSSVPGLSEAVAVALGTAINRGLTKLGERVR